MRRKTIFFTRNKPLNVFFHFCQKFNVSFNTKQIDQDVYTRKLNIYNIISITYKFIVFLM
ncbi:MAG: hypothetical protein CVU62_00090 [Deltaproteobacteria bacterium HGW-Deltaproteobacteria-2]|nr:MAG: hypothetical protein CVU62_00090 [Deltaproteobacteria bacterium HGW-Deltaproteobacteria-2]